MVGWADAASLAWASASGLTHSRWTEGANTGVATLRGLRPRRPATFCDRRLGNLIHDAGELKFAGLLCQ